MVGTIAVSLSFSPCCSCPVLVTGICCRTDDSDIQLSLASNNHLHVDLVSVPPYTPTWNCLHSVPTEHQRNTRFISFHQAHDLKEIIDCMFLC